MKIILGFAMLVLFAGPVRAQEPNTIDGNFLLGSCQAAVRYLDNPNTTLSTYEFWRAGYCLGVVNGVADESGQHCLPENGIYNQALRIVLKFLQDHPEKLHQRGTWLTAEALRTAFPCSK